MGRNGERCVGGEGVECVVQGYHPGDKDNIRECFSIQETSFFRKNTGPNCQFQLPEISGIQIPLLRTITVFDSQ